MDYKLSLTAFDIASQGGYKKQIEKPSNLVSILDYRLMDDEKYGLGYIGPAINESLWITPYN